LPFLQKEFLRIQKNNTDPNNNLLKDDEPLRFNNAVSSFVLNEDEKIPDIGEDREKEEKRDDEMNQNVVGNNKEEEERNDELLVFNLKFIKTALLTNVQVK